MPPSQASTALADRSQPGEALYPVQLELSQQPRLLTPMSCFIYSLSVKPQLRLLSTWLPCPIGLLIEPGVSTRSPALLKKVPCLGTVLSMAVISCPAPTCLLLHYSKTRGKEEGGQDSQKDSRQSQRHTQACSLLRERGTDGSLGCV